jgi:Predicted transcriptional regulator
MKSKLTRPPLARMLKIHEALQRGRFPNCTTLARELEMTTKTIQRDIEFMRDQLGLPIAYDASRRGYDYTEPVASFPAVQVSEGEVLALLVAGRALAQYRGTPYAAQLKTAFDKLTAGLDEMVSFQAGAGLADISFGSVGQTEAHLGTFEVLSNALSLRREVSFDYRKPGSAAPERRRVWPYHLAYRDNLCYLIGHDVNKNAVRQFALSRMGEVTLRQKRFAVPADFSAEKYFTGAFGAEGGTGDYFVCIRFDAVAAFYIRERRWHPSQHLTDLPDGGAELTLRLSSLAEVERWILSWGAHAEVLEPSELVQSIHSAVAKLAARYRPDSYVVRHDLLPPHQV